MLLRRDKQKGGFGEYDHELKDRICTVLEHIEHMEKIRHKIWVHVDSLEIKYPKWLWHVN